MSFIEESTINLIKQVSITLVAKQLGISVKHKKALCYNGHDTQPSLQIDDKRGFHCFGCDEKGDVINLVMNVKKIKFPEACTWLMQQFNIYDHKQLIKTKSYPTAITNIKEKPPVDYAPNFEIYEWLINNLKLSEIAKTYLINRRGFSNELIEQLEIRDIPDPQTIYHKLKEKWGQDLLLQCGLCKKGDNEFIKFTWWDHVIIFPFTNVNLRIEYLQGRMIKDGKIKYINLSNIKPSIYNLCVLNDLVTNENLLICEGIPDTITALAMGFKAIGVLGAHNFNKDYIRLLINFNLYVVPDADQGGERFIKSVKDAFRAHGKTINVFRIPKGNNDLNEFFVKKNSGLQ